MKIEIRKIEVTARKRLVSQKVIDSLVDSISQVGLLNPIQVAKVDGHYRLIAGLHRLKATERLGWQEIEATIVDIEDALKQELVEIDENLIRAELNALEKAEHLLRRKEIYEELHPETKAGVKGALVKHGRISANETVSFAEDTARKTGLSPRTIQQDVQIAEKIIPEVKEQIRDSKLANSKRELLSLARLDPETQKQVVEKIETKQAKNIDEAKHDILIKQTREHRETNPSLYHAQEKQIESIRQAYRKVRDVFFNTPAKPSVMRFLEDYQNLLAVTEETTRQVREMVSGKVNIKDSEALVERIKATGRELKQLYYLLQPSQPKPAQGNGNGNGSQEKEQKDSEKKCKGCYKESWCMVKSWNPEMCDGPFRDKQLQN
ncbi:MAG: ParB/RepB/Spo0J family partition protein [Thermodesulfovibrionales bacterium]